MSVGVWNVGGTYYAGPALVGSAFGGVFDHHVGAFFVVVDVAVSVLHPGRHHGDSVQWTVFLDTVLDHFMGSCPQGFCVRCSDGFDRAIYVGDVSSQKCSVIRSVVVKAANGIHTINGV